MSMTLKIDIRGVNALQKKLDKMKTTGVEVGFFPEDVYGPENNNLPVAQVVMYQEQGALEYPSRPFFTYTVEDKMVHFHLARALEKAAKAIFINSNSLEAELKKVGEILKDELETAIDDYPGRNALSWEKVKGFNDPLRYTDKMINSVKVKIKK